VTSGAGWGYVSVTVPPAVPTLGHWTLIVLTLLVLTSFTVFLFKRRRLARA
jgi:hypothetical protein